MEGQKEIIFDLIRKATDTKLHSDENLLEDLPADVKEYLRNFAPVPRSTGDSIIFPCAWKEENGPETHTFLVADLFPTWNNEWWKPIQDMIRKEREIYMYKGKRVYPQFKYKLGNLYEEIAPQDGTFIDTRPTHKFIIIEEEGKIKLYMVPSNLLLEPEGWRLGEGRLVKERFYTGDFEITEIPDYLPPFLRGNSPPTTLDLRFTKIREIGEEFTMAFNETKEGGNILLPPGVEIKGRAFRDAKIKSINLDNARLCAESFRFTNLKEIDLSRSDLKVIPPDCFADSTVEEILLPPELESIQEGAFAESQLEALVLPKGLKNIYPEAFRHCQLERVTLPESIQWIGMGAFSECHKLKKIDLSNLKLGQIAASCFIASNLEEVLLPLELYKIQEWAFAATALKKLVLPEGLKFIGKNAFFQSYLKKIDMSRSDLKVISERCFTESKVEEVLLPPKLEKIQEYAFMYTHLKKLVLPEGLEYIGEGAFARSQLEEITIPQSILRIEKGAFYECFKLKRIDLSRSRIQIIPYMCFENSELEEVLLPPTLNSIEKFAFYGTKLKELVLPEGLELIEEGAFSSCKLEKVRFPGSIKSIGEGAFGNNPSLEIIGPARILHQENAFDPGEWVESDGTYTRQIQNEFRYSLRF